jgi:hypothetical protein
MTLLKINIESICTLDSALRFLMDIIPMKITEDCQKHIECRKKIFIRIEFLLL